MIICHLIPNHLILETPSAAEVGLVQFVWFSVWQVLSQHDNRGKPELRPRRPWPRLWVEKARGSHLLLFIGKGELQPQLDNALQDVNDLYLLLEETEKQAVRKALVEERGRFCTFIAYLQPMVVGALFPWSDAALLGTRQLTAVQGIPQPLFRQILIFEHVNNWLLLPNYNAVTGLVLLVPAPRLVQCPAFRQVGWKLCTKENVCPGHSIELLPECWRG